MLHIKKVIIYKPFGNTFTISWAIFLKVKSIPVKYLESYIIKLVLNDSTLYSKL